VAAPKAPVLGSSKNVTLEEGIFAAEMKPHLVHETVRAELNDARSATRGGKSRGLVAGGRSKPWRQKGTGRARAGALSVPHRYGGGAAFGPKPRHYTVKVNRKARRKALRAALTLHAERGTVAVLDGSTFSEPATKQAADTLRKWGADAPTLIVVGAEEETVAKSFRNIQGITVALASAAGVADVVGASSLVITEAALEELKGRAV
jgi:large subunit ribosomal protein L4